MIKKLVQRYAHSSKELIPGFRKILPLLQFIPFCHISFPRLFYPINVFGREAFNATIEEREETDPYCPDFGSSLMTGACHHLSSAAVFYYDRFSARLAVPSIAGAKIRRFSVSAKF